MWVKVQIYKKGGEKLLPWHKVTLHGSHYQIQQGTTNLIMPWNWNAESSSECAAGQDQDSTYHVVLIAHGRVIPCIHWSQGSPQPCGFSAAAQKAGEAGAVVEFEAGFPTLLAQPALDNRYGVPSKDSKLLLTITTILYCCKNVLGGLFAPCIKIPGPSLPGHRCHERSIQIAMSCSPCVQLAGGRAAPHLTVQRSRRLPATSSSHVWKDGIWKQHVVGITMIIFIIS